MKTAIHYISDVVSISRGQYHGSVGMTLSACRAHIRYVERRCVQLNLNIDKWMKKIESEIQKSAKATALVKAVFAMPNDMEPNQGSEFLLDFLSSQEIFVERTKRTDGEKTVYEKKYVALPRENFGVGTHVDKIDNHHNHVWWLNKSASGKSVNIDKESLRSLHANWREYLQQHGYELKDAEIKGKHRGYLYGEKKTRQVEKTTDAFENNSEKMESAEADSANISSAVDMPDFTFSVPEVEKEKEEEQKEHENKEVIIEFAMPEITKANEFTEEQLDKIRAEIADICDETARDSDLIELDDIDFENLSDDEIESKLEQYYKKFGYQIELKKNTYIINKLRQLENLESDEIPESQIPNMKLDVSRLGKSWRKERQLQRVRNKLNAHRANRARCRRKSTKKQKGRVKMSDTLIGFIAQKSIESFKKKADEIQRRKSESAESTIAKVEQSAFVNHVVSNAPKLKR